MCTPAIRGEFNGIFGKSCDMVLDAVFTDEDDGTDDTSYDYADDDYAERDIETVMEDTEGTGFESEPIIEKSVMLDGEIYILEDQNCADDDDYLDEYDDFTDDELDTYYEEHGYKDD